MHTANGFGIDPRMMNERPRRPRSEFWDGVVWGALGSALLLMFIIMLSVNVMRTSTDAITGEARACLNDFAAANQRIEELQTPIVLFEDKAPAELPHFDFHGLADIRPGALFAAGNTDLRPRWVIQAGRTPIDIWHAPAAYGLYDDKAKKITGPFKIQ